MWYSESGLAQFVFMLGHLQSVLKKRTYTYHQKEIERNRFELESSLFTGGIASLVTQGVLVRSIQC